LFAACPFKIFYEPSAAHWQFVPAVNTFELMELGNDVQAAEIKCLDIGNVEFGLSKTTGRKCLQLSLFEHSTCLQWRPEKRFIVIKELPSYLEKYFKTMWGFECAFDCGEIVNLTIWIKWKQNEGIVAWFSVWRQYILSARLKLPGLHQDLILFLE